MNDMPWGCVEVGRVSVGKIIVKAVLYLKKKKEIVVVKVETIKLEWKLSGWQL